MSPDLVSACVFCAGLLLGIEAPPWPGFGAEIGFSYGTGARRVDPAPGRQDLSDVTPKFVLVGAGGAREAAGDLGAGTPAAQWDVRVALAPSHTEQTQTPYSLDNVVTTGTGRYENFSLLVRLPAGGRDSVEAGAIRKTHKSTDLVHLGGERFVLGEERTLSAERIDVALGWRHRWPGLEAAVSARYTKPSGSTGTTGTFRIAGSPLYGAGLELRARRGRWTAWVAGERTAGSLTVHEESAPDFRSHDGSARASLEAYRVGGLWSGARTEAMASATWDRSRLPFVSFAPLGTETVLFEQGFSSDSRTRQIFADLTVRRAIGRAVRLRASLRLGYGNETVSLRDPEGVREPRRLDVTRTGVFGAGLSRALGSPEASLFLGADFKVDLK
ncbi:MAG: hypothetical protein M3S32_06100 [Acidobacteriota bacterium]|nr:hypothetical protein [Acidobacteriota bacterium]